MTKYEKISVLAKETARSIGENKESWMNYLDVASRLYKYPFEDQILIYAQRPDATACAPLEMWNEKMFCWVNRGAKGIALIDQESDYPRLRYVFDVSDVHKARRIGKSPFIWNIREEHEEGILAALERIYGTTNQDSSFEDRIYQISKRIADDYYEEIVDDLIDVSAGSYLEDLDGDTVSLRLRETLEQSVCYTVLKRCGFDMAEYEGEFPFDYIHEFNTLRTLSVLGSATSELCEPMLIQIGRSIARYDRELARHPSHARASRKEARVIREDDFVIGLDSNTSDWFVYDNVTAKNICYCDSEEEAKEHILWMVTHNQFYKNERMEKENEPDIREERRLPDSESDTRRGEADHVDQVRNPAEELSEELQTGDLQRNASERRIDGALSGDSGTGRTEVRQSDGETHEVTGSDGAVESDQSLGVDKKDEHDLSAGGGSDSSGTGLSVEELESYTPPENSPYRQMDLFSLMSEQLGNIAVAQVEKPIHLSFPGTISEEKVAKILCTGGGLENSRKRIFAKYEQRKTPEEMTDFLRREYGSTGKGFNFGEEQISVWFDENGMSAAHGNSALEHTELKLSWEEIEKIIRSQVESGTYMDSTEAYMVDYYERKRITNQLYFFYRDSIGEFPKGLEISGYNYPGEEEYLMDLLTKPDKIQNIVACLDETLQKIESGEISIRFRLAKNPYELREDVADLLKERISYPLAEKVDVLTEDFITSDEIDYVLSSGSGFAQGSFRIYDFYQKDHTVKEAADFLKKEYGTGGSNSALAGSDNSYKDYDAKGIRLRKGHIFTPDAEVLLSWNVVAKRIEKLIQQGRYLSDKKKTEYAAYKEEQEKKALEQAKEELSGVDTPDEEESIQPEEIHAENYVITSDELGIGTPKEKFRWNVEAIQTLQKIEAEERMATAEEQETLARYVGWGGLADAFDETKSAWANEYQELKSLLSDEEYVSARESTLNAYYTSPTIIRGIYHTLEKMGFAKGNILEPSMGIGNFFGMLPETMRDSKLYGAELDSLTGRMAKQLYPKANITVDGFEKTGYPNDFFDVVIGNVPFGQYKVPDKKYDKQNFGGTGFLIHDYFFAKAIDQVRPGGIIAFITSKGTMDKENPKVRKYIAQRAELLGAVRLPNTAFKENAGTEVTSDIIFLKKRDRVIDIEPDWVHLSEDDNGVVMNHYFTENPDMIVGSMEMVSGPYGMESTCVADTSLPFEEQLEAAFSQISGEYEEIELELSEESTMDEVIPAIPEVKNFSYTLVDEKLYYRENSVMKPVEASEGMIRRIHGMVAIRDCTQELIRLQLEEYPEEDIKAEQKQLNDLYDDFVKENGRIVSKTNKRAFHQDSSYCLLCSLEKLDEEGNFLGKADMFSKRTIKKTEVVTSVDTASEALATGNPYIKEKMDLDIQVSKLKLMKANHTSQIYRLEDNIAKHYPKQIETLKERIRGFEADIETAHKHMPEDKESFVMKVGSRTYYDKKEAGTALIALCKQMNAMGQTVPVGEYAGFAMKVTFDSFNRKFVMSLKGEISHNLEIGSDALGNITRINNVLENMDKELAEARTKLENVSHQLETAKIEVQKPFPAEQELKEKMERLAALDALLNMDEKGEDVVLDEEPKVMPLGEWMVEHLMPEFMEENEITEERARELLADMVSEEEDEIVCFSTELNGASLDDEEMLKQMAEYMDGDYYAIPISESDYLIAPKTEQDTVVYLQAVLGRLGSSILTSEAVTTHAAYEYDSSLQTMKPFNHVGILQGLMAVGEEKMTYHTETFREEAKKEKKH